MFWQKSGFVIFLQPRQVVLDAGNRRRAVVRFLFDDVVLDARFFCGGEHGTEVDFARAHRGALVLAFGLVLKRMINDQYQFNLSSLKIALCAAEPISPLTTNKSLGLAPDR